MNNETLTAIAHVTREATCPHCHIFSQMEMHRRDGCNHRCWVCPSCNQIVAHKAIVNSDIGGHWIPKAFMPYVNTDDLPVYTPDGEQVPKCVLCGQRGAELHHFAPRSFFGDECEQWPKAYLCREHHMQWHDRVTPGLVRKMGEK